MNEELKDKITELFREKLGLSPEITMIHQLGGLTNYNYRVNTSLGDFVVRYPGIGTEELINRKDEFEFTQLSNRLGIDAKNYYFDGQTGIKISAYIPNSLTFNPKLLRKSDNLEKVAILFRKLHHSDEQVAVEFNVFEKIKEYEDLINKTQRNNYWDDYPKVRAEIYALKEEYDGFNVELKFCHNDPLCENFVLGEDKLYLVDWEYGGMNDPLWDLADVMIEADLDEKQEELFKRYYFNRRVTKEEDRRIVMNKVFLDFLWSLWGKQRYSIGDDDMQAYADERYIRMKNNLSLLLGKLKEK